MTPLAIDALDSDADRLDSPVDRIDVPMQRLSQALANRTATTPLSVWRWVVLQRMIAVRDLMVEESEQPQDWLAARRSRSLRERNALLGRMSELRFRVLGDPDLDQVNYELQRLVVDVRHYLQKMNDLAYDEVEGEIGGSE